MSIYATRLRFEASATIEDAQLRNVVGSAKVPAESRDDAAPWRYSGSHVLPRATDERAGYCIVNSIPDHVEGERRPHDWLRIDVGDGVRSVNVLIDRTPATKLHDMLGAWPNGK